MYFEIKKHFLAFKEWAGHHADGRPILKRAKPYMQDIYIGPTDAPFSLCLDHRVPPISGRRDGDRDWDRVINNNPVFKRVKE